MALMRILGRENLFIRYGRKCMINVFETTTLIEIALIELNSLH